MSQDSGQKTEKASAKKKKDAREKGETHKSNDLASAVMMFITFGTLKIGYDGFMTSMTKFVSGSLSSNLTDKANDLTGAAIVSDYKSVLFTILPLILPLFIVSVIGGILVHVVQTGPMLVTSKLKPDFQKISPLKGFKRIFSATTFVELFKSIIKITVIVWIVYSQIRDGIKTFAGLVYVNVQRAFSEIMSMGFSMGIMIALALIGFSFLDYLYQWWKFEKDLMMTKQEVKEENKQLEGDPKIKGMIKQQQRKMSSMRMMHSVHEADVIITNPDHLAVALRYKESVDKAPVVIAKGQDHLAKKIKDLAREHKVTIVENKPVARALYASCEVGDEIPAEMYQAIADILIYVYKAAKER